MQNKKIKLTKKSNSIAISENYYPSTMEEITPFIRAVGPWNWEATMQKNSSDYRMQ